MRRISIARAFTRFALVGTLFLGLNGCTQEVSVVSSEEVLSDATLQEQQEWVTEQAEAVIEITGTEGKWEDSFGEGLQWSDQGEQIIGLNPPVRCSFGNTGSNPAALELPLWSVPLEGDHFALAEKVREAWVSEGWVVSDVIRMGDTAAGNEIKFRADRDKGGILSLNVADLGGGKLMHLYIRAACSSHPTVIQ